MDVTYNFTPGTRAVAEQVNQNFADVKSAVDPLQADVADIKTQLTSGIVLPDGSVDFTRLQSYKTYTVSNATNATPIVVTAVGHSFLTGDKVQIAGVGGNTAANGTFTITKIGADTFSLDGSVGNGAFSSNGTAIIVPVNAGNLINKAYLDANAGALKISALGTVSSNITLDTNTVTTADVSGAISITLPTTLVAGNENTVVFDFTTTSSSSPTINQDSTTKSITSATNATPIVITATAHGFNTGDKVYITGVLGNTAANGTWVITRLTADTFSLNGSVGNGAYTSGGTVRKANFKWSDKNGGKAPSAYSTIAGVRNVLVFKTHDNGANWEAEYTTYGGVELVYNRPTLTTNGTIGGSSPAVAWLSPEYSTNYAYKGMDGSISTFASTTQTTLPISFVFDSLIPIKASKWSFTNTASGNTTISGLSIYGSNDNMNWVLQGNFTNSVATNGSIWDASISGSSQDFYRYHKFVITSYIYGSTTYPAICELNPTAVYIGV